MWREAIRAVRELRPRAFLFENVRGLLRPAFADYLQFIRLQLAWPDVTRRGGAWRDARAALRQHAHRALPDYHVIVQGINAADYGAPQKRHRAIILGVRADVAPEVRFPRPTHSRDALIWSQRISGEYWDRHSISRRSRPAMTVADAFVLARLKQQEHRPEELSWMTVRDALGDLPRPRLHAEVIPNHVLHPGARTYPRHTGSVWDEPAKAIKAGDHGVPGGENMIVLRDGAVRYFTLREMARLQGFPDTFVIHGSWRAPIRQLGNAVPVQVGRAFASALGRVMDSSDSIVESRRPRGRTAAA
jgi:DNA (cytosine-5)-methyltransferase 1